MAVTVALIICGLAPAKPPAIMVTNSSTLAVTARTESGHSCDIGYRRWVDIPSAASGTSSSIPSTRLLLTTPPSLIFVPIATTRLKAAVRAFSDGSFVPNTVSGMREGIMCSESDGIKGTRTVMKLKRSCFRVNKRMYNFAHHLTFFAAGELLSKRSSSSLKTPGASAIGTVPPSVSLAKIL
jgi:hypothetical protein